MVALVGVAAMRAAEPARGVPAALAYLEKEVPRWRAEHACHSCHNDGDGLRALLLGGRGKAAPVAIAALADPSKWDSPLARLQFAAAAREALRAGAVEAAVLARAAALVAADQQADGRWKVEEELAAGSPVTYGSVLATFMARGVLEAANAKEYAAAIARATTWLSAREPKHVSELAVLAWALGRPADRTKLLAAQLPNGSWNNEPFDTALALLALGGDNAKARAYLLEAQFEPGGWPGTTRPAGGESYAQHISTTAWVAMALMLPEAGATASRAAR